MWRSSADADKVTVLVSMAKSRHRELRGQKKLDINSERPDTSASSGLPPMGRPIAASQWHVGIKQDDVSRGTLLVATVSEKSHCADKRRVCLRFGTYIARRTSECFHEHFRRSAEIFCLRLYSIASSIYDCDKAAGWLLTIGWHSLF
jgi:hypothetical protein